MLLGELRFCAKYPFSQQARSILKQLDLNSVSDDLLAASAARVERGLKRADLAAKLNEIVSSQETFLRAEVLAFPVSKIIVSLSGDSYLLKQFARAEADRVKYFLKFEGDEAVFELASQLFSPERSDRGLTAAMPDFLRLLPGGVKLVDQDISAGRVSVPRELLDAMVAESVFQSVSSTRVAESAVPKEFIFWANEVKKHRRVFAPDIPAGDFDTRAAPPCIRKILSDLGSPEKVGHMSRFVLATFCANTGVPIETAVSFFSKQPNWNEQKTRYHLEHAYGLKSNKTKYSTPNCVKMESLGLCYRDDSCKWSNPSFYYKRMRPRIAPQQGVPVQEAPGK